MALNKFIALLKRAQIHFIVSGIFLFNSKSILMIFEEIFLQRVLLWILCSNSIFKYIFLGNQFFIDGEM